jgi:hypothetical protein
MPGIRQARLSAPFPDRDHDDERDGGLLAFDDPLMEKSLARIGAQIDINGDKASRRG